jgi:hypothetical protein
MNSAKLPQLRLIIHDTVSVPDKRQNTAKLGHPFGIYVFVFRMREIHNYVILIHVRKEIHSKKL